MSVTVTTNGKGAVPAVAGGVEVVSNGQVSAALAVGAEVATNGQAATNDESTETLFPQVYQDLAEVEARLRQVIHSKLAVVPEVFLHTVHAGGKRVRPALALLCGRAVGQLTEATFDVAVVSEMIHLASLIHDDVIDNGGRRRARLTANRIWGNKSSVLVGDYIHSVAYRLLCRRCPIEVVERLTQTVERMVEGELSQMYNEHSLTVTEPLYYQIVGDKTACLMALACELGAYVSGGAPGIVEQLSTYGLKVGLAFQVVDDLLDLTGDEERIGKPIGSDVRCGRLTLPLIYTLQHGGACADTLREVLQQDELDLDDVRRVRDLAGEAGGLAYAADCAVRLSDEAREQLHHLPNDEPREALEALAHYIVARTR